MRKEAFLAEGAARTKPHNSGLAGVLARLIVWVWLEFGFEE